jgi:starch synthase
MKILIAASEFDPCARTGDFAVQVARLAAATASSGHETTVALPLYRCIREGRIPGLKRGKIRLQIQLGAARLPCDVWEAEGPNGVRLLFLERDEFYDRTGLYGMDGRDYQDNAARFIFFSKGVAELARRESPDILHALGWQAGLAPVFVRDQRLRVPTVLSPAGLEYQGNFWSHDFALTNLPGDWFPNVLEFYGSMNFLKAGLLCADAVVLPGALQVAAMQTPEHGCGLENILRQHAGKLEGITPGIDLPNISAPSVKEKSAAREALFQSTGKTARAVFAVHTATTGEDGLSLLCEALSRLPQREVLVILCGPVPDSKRREVETTLRRRAGGLAHFAEPSAEEIDRILAASDFVLVPGPLHPEGGFFRAALRRGTIPIAGQCPGLHELVRDHDPVTGLGNGLVFYRHSTAALLDAILRAIQLPEAVRRDLSECNRGMDFSWNTAARALDRLYARLTGRTDRIAA